MLAYQITFPGGDTQGVLNAEYRIPIAGPVTIAAFTDLGTVGRVQEEPVAARSDQYRVLERPVSIRFAQQ